MLAIEVFIWSIIFFLAPGDYSATVTTVTFGPDKMPQEVSVPIVDDDFAENNETFFGNLRIPAGSADMIQLDPGRANATISDNDGKHFIFYSCDSIMTMYWPNQLCTSFSCSKFKF